MRNFIDMVNESGAFHGSNKNFEEFSVGHIGTGSGRATFGWGVYVSKQKSIARRYKKKEGLIYHVDIPEDEEFLLWEKIFDQQSPYIQKVLNKLNYDKIRQRMIDEEQIAGYERPYNYDTGENIYGVITTSKMTPSMGPNYSWTDDQKKASMFMLRAGIAGIKHLDPETGSRTNDHYNYVIFDPRRIKIIKTTKS